MAGKVMAAVDLGASSGRVIAGEVRDSRLVLRETARFPNAPVRVPTAEGDRLYWDALRLWEAIVGGLREAGRGERLASVAVDSWAVDYGLLDSRGALLGNPASYRCGRTEGAPQRFFERLSQEEAYALVGSQVQPFNTVFQLVAEPPERIAQARRALLLPDLFSYWLSGAEVTEVTNASSTGLLDPGTRRWQPDALRALREGFGCDAERLFGPLVEPGTRLGPVAGAIPGATGAEVVAVGSHDTASAVVAVPAQRADFAYISCGTWSLVGLELDAPVRTPAARLANLTNELGVDGRVRFLKNVMGLWVFNETVRLWRDEGQEIALAELVAEAARAEALRTVVDLVDGEFLEPGDMPARIAAAARRTDQPVPETRAQVVRCIVDSLALAYRRAIREAAQVAGRDVSVVHMVGGGIQNRLLCQLTADATGLPVVAGPVEATALGNLAVQARALGIVAGDLSDLRRLVRDSSDLVEYAPARDEQAWAAAERRVGWLSLSKPLGG